MNTEVLSPAVRRRPAGIVLFRMTSDEFAHLPESEQKLELLDGKVIMAASPRPSHQVFGGELYAVLKPWIVSNRLGRLFPATDVRLDDDWTPCPDLSFLKTEHLGRVGDTQIVGPVDLAVEILSPSNPENDLEVKFAAYARHGH